MKQYLTGRLIGGAIDTFQRTTILVTTVNFAMMAATFYNTTGAPIILSYIPWMTFPAFMVALIVFVVLSMAIFYMFVTPSAMAFGNDQLWSHASPQRVHLERIEAKIDALIEKIGKETHE